MRRGLACMAALCAAASSLAASEGAAYLKIPQGARSSAMGGAVSALPGSAEALWFSPMAPAGLRGIEASFSRMAWIGETKNDYLAVATSFGSASRQGLGLYANLISTEDVTRDAMGNDGGKFSNSALVIGAAYAFSLGPATLGLGLKGFQERFFGLEQNSAAGDLGVRLNFAKGAFRLAGVAQNLGGGLNYSSDLGQVSAPLSYRAGLAAESKKLGLLASLELRLMPESSASILSAGAQYALPLGPFGLALRGGYESSGARIGGLSGFTLGGGFKMGELSADFAWLPQGALGSPYRMTLSWCFL